MAKQSYHHATLACIVIAGILAGASIILLIASLWWQGLIEYIPVYREIPKEVTCVYEVPRREGFFYVCHTMTAVNNEVNDPKNPCVAIDYMADGVPFQADDDGHSELSEWRRLSVIGVVLGAILAAIGLALLIFFGIGWLKIIDRVEFRRLDRLLVGAAFLFAGFACQLGITFLHVTYMRDKVVETNRLQLIYTSWDHLFENEFILQYSHSYKMLTAAVYMLEVAGIIILVSGQLAYLLSEVNDMEHDTMYGALEYNPTLPRYTVDPQDNSGFLNDVQSKEDIRRQSGYYNLQ